MGIGEEIIRDTVIQEIFEIHEQQLVETIVYKKFRQDFDTELVKRMINVWKLTQTEVSNRTGMCRGKVVRLIRELRAAGEVS